jgi:hypothetical protein
LSEDIYIPDENEKDEGNQDVDTIVFDSDIEK